MKTYYERLKAGLKAKGWSEDITDRSKYTAFVHPTEREGRKLFIGKNGALRTGECASRSWSIGDATRQSLYYKELLAAGDGVLSESKRSVDKYI